tara:strand:+ start:457 stop:729 length:273 start_codon:yes stop_codon:yes gene_type:complete|eukprot:scaffold38735_cov69-Phaeocystis_antarctica.AAC.6
MEGRMRIEFNVIDDLKRVQLAEEPVELAIAITTTQYASLTKKIGELVPELLALLRLTDRELGKSPEHSSPTRRNCVAREGVKVQRGWTRK